MSEPLPPTEIEQRLTARGLLNVSDWSIYDKAQISGRIPPRGEWFVFFQNAGEAWIEIYPPGRYPFAVEGSGASGGWDPMALGHEPPVIWSYLCKTADPPDAYDGADIYEPVIVRFLDLWRTGTKPIPL